VILLDPDARPVIAHRGASGRCPENTWQAFDAALADGADAIELDVHRSADGVVVVMHDATVDRTTDGSGPVGELTAEALSALNPGDGAGVPTLAGVLERYASVPLLIELKTVACASPVAVLLRRHGAAHRVLLGSFDHAALRPFRAAPFHCTGSRRDTGLAWAASRVGLGWGGRCEAFSVPARHRGVRVVDGRFMRACRRRGRPVHVWTVDDVDEARNLRAAGVAGIITNLPARMREIDSPATGDG
jgi:glycerophosphoryl diester phosphodiesterase